METQIVQTQNSDLSDTHLDGLGTVLQEKLQARIERGISRSASYLDRIDTEGRLLNDFILPLGANKKVAFFSETDKVFMNITNGEVHNYSLHPHAIAQAGDKLGIPQSYIKSLAESKLEWKTDLAAKLLNEHSLHATRQRVLVREVGGEIRGILSDQYRRLNSTEIYSSFITAVKEQSAVIYDAYADDTRSYLETLYPQLISVPTLKNGIVYMAYGIRLSSSDFGDGALELRAFLVQTVCMNGLVRDSVLRQIHLGAKIPDNIQLSERTYRLDTQTQASIIKDSVKQLMSKDSIYSNALQIQRASEMEVDLEKEFKLLPKVGLSKNETEEVKTVITSNKSSDGVQGENTLWKLAQSIGAVARAKDERRKRELEEISGKLLERIKVN